jgi:hypothetical protein
MKIGVSEGYWDLTTVDVGEDEKREGCGCGWVDKMIRAGPHCHFQQSLCPRDLQSCASAIPVPNIAVSKPFFGF